MISFAAAIVPILFALLLPSSAHPHLQRRGLPGAVYTCDDPNFRGNCQWREPSTRCAQQGPKGLGVESIGPDPGGFCTLYDKFDCTGREVQVVRFPGIQSGIPEFGSFKCLMDTPQARAIGPNAAAAGAKSTLDPFADPRLAGGVGSMERKQHLKEIKQMEKDDFSQGLIGFKKGVYY